MVLELKVPHETHISALSNLWPVFVSYVLSFVYVAIYWNNHHHLFKAVEHVRGSTLWANMHLLFWLSLIPFATAWAGENHFAPITVAMYGFVLMMTAVAYYILTRVLLVHHGRESTLAKALGSDTKGRISIVFYAIAIGVAYWNEIVACVIYIGMAIVWIIPDRRIEEKVEEVEEIEKADKED